MALDTPIYSLTTVATSPYGETLVEFFTDPPNSALTARLRDRVAEGELTSFEVREGYLNGGDSRIVEFAR